MFLNCYFIYPRSELASISLLDIVRIERHGVLRRSLEVVSAGLALDLRIFSRDHAYETITAATRARKENPL